MKESEQSLQEGDLQSLILSKINMFQFISEFSETFFVPQRTGNIQLSCSGYIFNKSDEKSNYDDEKIVVSSIAQSMSDLLKVKLSIPYLQQLEV